MTDIDLYGNELTSVSGWVCLDFANTAEWHASSAPIEKLNSYTDLVNWAIGVGLLSDEAAGGLLREANENPAEAAKIHKKGILLREAIYDIFSNIAAGKLPEGNDISILNAALAEAFDHLKITSNEAGINWKWTNHEGALDQMLWPAAYSAAGLLTSKALTRVGRCADERGCGWLFIDTSKNHSRQWCGEGCANRAKAKRHYARHKKKRAET